MAEAFSAEILAEIPNRAVHGGAPLLLLRAADGRFALGQRIGDAVETRSDWVSEQKILDAALRVLAGDPAAMTHPKALLHIALAFVGVFVAAERRKREGQTSPGARL